MQVQSLTPTQLESIAIRKAFRQKIAARAVPDPGIDLKRIPVVEIIPVELPLEPPPVLFETPDPWQERRHLEKLWFEIIDEIPKDTRPVLISEVQSVCCSYFHVAKVDLVGTSRARWIVRPRQIAMYLCRQFCGRSLPEIARRFGGRDHSTAHNAIRVISDLLRTDTGIAHDVAHLEARFS